MLKLADLWACLLRHAETETKPTHKHRHTLHDMNTRVQRANAKQLQVQRVLAEAEQARKRSAENHSRYSLQLGRGSKLTRVDGVLTRNQ